MKAHLIASRSVSPSAMRELLRELDRLKAKAPVGSSFWTNTLAASPWVRLLADADWWEQVAGDVSAMQQLADAFAALVAQEGTTELIAGLPGPQQLFGVEMRLVGGSGDRLKRQLAQLVAHLPCVEELLLSHSRLGVATATGYFLSFPPDGRPRLSWFDRQTLAQQEAVLAPDPRQAATTAPHPRADARPASTSGSLRHA